MGSPEHEAGTLGRAAAQVDGGCGSGCITYGKRGGRIHTYIHTGFEDSLWLCVCAVISIGLGFHFLAGGVRDKLAKSREREGEEFLLY